MLKVVNAGIAHLVCEPDQKNQRTTTGAAHLLGGAPLPKAEFVATHLLDLLKGLVPHFYFDEANNVAIPLNCKVKVITDWQLAKRASEGLLKKERDLALFLKVGLCFV
jgi:hypothetical protein